MGIEWDKDSLLKNKEQSYCRRKYLLTTACTHVSTQISIQNIGTTDYRIDFQFNIFLSLPLLVSCSFFFFGKKRFDFLNWIRVCWKWQSLFWMFTFFSFSISCQCFMCPYTAHQRIRGMWNNTMCRYQIDWRCKYYISASSSSRQRITVNGFNRIWAFLIATLNRMGFSLSNGYNLMEIWSSFSSIKKPPATQTVKEMQNQRGNENAHSVARAHNLFEKK